MADIAPYGRDLTTGIIRAFTASDTLSDEDGNALISANLSLPPTPIVFNSGVRATGISSGSAAISASPLSVPANTFTTFFLLWYEATLRYQFNAGGPHTAVAEVTINGSTITALGARNPQTGPGSNSVGFFTIGNRNAGCFLFHAGNGFVPGALHTCDWGNFVCGSLTGLTQLSDLYMAVAGV